MNGPAAQRPTQVRSLPASRGFGGLFEKQDGFRIFLFALTVVTISRVHMHFGLGALRPALVMAAGALVYAVLRPRVVSWRSLFQYWPSRVIAGLAVVACLSAPFGISLGAAASFILQDFSKVLVYTVLLIVGFRGASDLRLIVSAYVISAAILVYFALFVFQLHATNSGVMRLDHLYTYDANDVGLIVLIAVPLALWLLGTLRRRGKILIALLLVGVGATVAQSGSRGAFVGGLALLFSLLWFVRSVSLQKRLLAVAAVSLGVVVTAPPGYWEQMRTILEPTQDYNWTTRNGRKELALRGLGYMWDYPVFGVGIGNFPRAEGMISEKARTNMPGTGLDWTPAHNSYVQVGAELGITGFLLWCALVFGGLMWASGLRRRLPRAWARGDPEQRFLYEASMYLPAAFVAFAVPAFFLSFAYRDPLYLLTSLLIGVQSAADRRLSLDRSAAVPGTIGPGDRRAITSPTRFARS